MNYYIKISLNEELIEYQECDNKFIKTKYNKKD